MLDIELNKTSEDNFSDTQTPSEEVETPVASDEVKPHRVVVADCGFHSLFG